MSLFNRVKNNNETMKTYSYEKNKIILKFQLRTDIKHQMKDFLEMLKVAQREIEEDIKNLK
jgi:hypothetical protein